MVVEGTLDFSSAHHLERELVEIARGGMSHVILDISRVRCIDSAGISSVIGGREELRSAGGGLVIRASSAMAVELPELRDMMELREASSSAGLVVSGSVN